MSEHIQAIGDRQDEAYKNSRKEHSRLPRMKPYCDAAAIRRAVRCCNPLDQAHLAPTIVTESARGPSGGCVGVELQTSMTVMDCGCGDGS